MNPRTRMVRDQIGALLRSSDVAMSTPDIADQMPPIEEIVGCHANRRPHGRGQVKTNHLMEICHGDHHHVVRRPYYTEAYRYLAQMLAAGEVERLKFSGARVVFWRWIGPAPVSVEELEAMFGGAP